MANAIKSSYHKGECPDCGDNIPDDVCTGQACENCDHVFSEQRAPDDAAMGFGEVTERLISLIAKSDEEFQAQIASGIGISLEELHDYVDRVEFPVVGEKNKHEV